MNPATPPMYAVVALLEETPATHFETGQPLRLRRGQIGTVVMTYADGACEVEFADRAGRTYALLPLAAAKLMPLHDTPQPAAA
jgi:hypothetical protein